MAKRSLREDETRAEQMGLAGANDNNLAVPDQVKQEGYEYHWASSAFRGEIDYSLEQLLRKFWLMVPVEKAKGYNRDPLKRNPLSDKCICHQELVLLERPIAYRKREVEARDDTWDQTLGSLEGVKDDYSNVYM